MKAVYETISGPIDQKRDWEFFKTLFVKDATMAAFVTTKAGKSVSVDMTVQQYVERAGPGMEKSGFYEKELHRTTNQYDSIAQIFSTYESRLKPDEKPMDRGINAIQCRFDGKRWWIQSLIWQSETEKSPVPKEFLPGGR